MLHLARSDGYGATLLEYEADDVNYEMARLVLGQDRDHIVTVFLLLHRERQGYINRGRCSFQSFILIINLINSLLVKS